MVFVIYTISSFSHTASLFTLLTPLLYTKFYHFPLATAYIIYNGLYFMYTCKINVWSHLDHTHTFDIKYYIYTYITFVLLLIYSFVINVSNIFMFYEFHLIKLWLILYISIYNIYIAAGSYKRWYMFRKLENVLTIL